MASSLFWTFLLPFSLYPDRYRMSEGPTHFFDGVSAGLTNAGINPIHPIVAVAFLAGLAGAWRTRREPAVLFLLLAWLSVTAVLGIAGPSLTRMLILLPVYLLAAALGIGAVLNRFPGLRPLFAAALVVVIITRAYAYFVRLPQTPLLYFGPAATSMGKRAEVLASHGRRVLCVVLKDANVIRYLTHSHSRTVRVSEFYLRPLVVQEIPLAEFNPDVLLIEDDERFTDLSGMFPSEWHVRTHDLFEEIRLRRGSR